MPLSSDIQQLKSRNARVEIDKAWEVSKTRRLIICVITYFAAVLVLKIIGAENYWLGALVPVVGFLLSTLSLPIFKKMWTKKFSK